MHIPVDRERSNALQLLLENLDTIYNGSPLGSSDALRTEQILPFARRLQDHSSLEKITADEDDDGDSIGHGVGDGDSDEDHHQSLHSGRFSTLSDAASLPSEMFVTDDDSSSQPIRSIRPQKALVAKRILQQSTKQKDVCRRLPLSRTDLVYSDDSEAEAGSEAGSEASLSDSEAGLSHSKTDPAGRRKAASRLPSSKVSHSHDSNSKVPDEMADHLHNASPQRYRRTRDLRRIPRMWKCEQQNCVFTVENHDPEHLISLQQRHNFLCHPQRSCGYCLYHTSSADELTVHVLQDNFDNTLPCSVPGYTRLLPNKELSHDHYIHDHRTTGIIPISSPEPQYCCSVQNCPFTTQKRGWLKQHLERFHRISWASRWEWFRHMTCSCCFDKFATNVAIGRHIYSNPDPAHKRMLRQLLWLHPFACPCCDERQFYEQDHITHLRTHSLDLQTHQCLVPACPMASKGAMSHADFLCHMICFHKLPVNPLKSCLYSDCEEVFTHDPVWQHLITLLEKRPFPP